MVREGMSPDMGLDTEGDGAGKMEYTLNQCPECLHDGTLMCCMDEEGLLFVQCSVCGLSGKRFMTVAEAVEYWNSHTRNRSRCAA